MVIQPNMTSKAIAEAWENTTEIFNLYNIPIVNEALRDLVQKNLLTELLTKLNNQVGSSSLTCVEGG